MAVGFDTSDEAQVKEGIEAVVARFGGIDILHNNAALTNPQIMMRDGMIHDLDVGLWDQMMAVNVRGYMLCTKYAVPQMLARGGGVIINTVLGSRHAGRGHATGVRHLQGRGDRLHAQRRDPVRQDGHPLRRR